MKPRTIQLKCPNCKCMSKPIPAGMGDRTIKCRRCGKFIRYAWRKQTTTLISRPERESVSGRIIY